MYVADAYPSRNILEPRTDDYDQLRFFQDFYGTSHDWRPRQGAAEDLNLPSLCRSLLIICPWWLSREEELMKQKQMLCLVGDCNRWICVVDIRSILYANECHLLIILIIVIIVVVVVMVMFSLACSWYRAMSRVQLINNAEAGHLIAWPSVQLLVMDRAGQPERAGRSILSVKRHRRQSNLFGSC